MTEIFGDPTAAQNSADPQRLQKPRAALSLA
jgi:hypothetical protein